MKIVFSRKGFDSQYGAIPSVVWPNSKEMLSFPIPVKSPEQGIKAYQLSFIGYKFSKLLSDLNCNWDKNGDNFHFDPMIQSLLPEVPPVGAFGQSGLALGHLKKAIFPKGISSCFLVNFVNAIGRVTSSCAIR